jgi:hypothetical protein
MVRRRLWGPPLRTSSDGEMQRRRGGPPTRDARGSIAGEGRTAGRGAPTAPLRPATAAAVCVTGVEAGWLPDTDGAGWWRGCRREMGGRGWRCSVVSGGDERSRRELKRM